MNPKIERDKPTVLVDIDGTLSKTWQSYARDFGKHALQCFVNVAKPANWVKGPRYIVEKSLQETDFYRKLPVYEGSRETLESLSDQYDFVIATRRKEYLKPDTEYWLAHNYPGVFSGVYYDVKDKGELAKKLGAVQLIDNDFVHYKAMERQGIKAVQFAPYRWNMYARRGTRKQAMTWKAVGDILNGAS